MYIYKVVCKYTHACYKREREREREEGGREGGREGERQRERETAYSASIEFNLHQYSH